MIQAGQYPYYFLLFSLAFLSLVFDFRNSSGQTKLILCFFLVLVLALFAGTRVGWNDQEGYIWLYDRVPTLPLLFSGKAFMQFYMEYFFVLLNSILKCFSDNPLSMFLLAAFITVALNLNSYKKYSPYFLLAVVFYCSNYYFSGAMIQIRMGIATALILFGMDYLVNKKWRAFFIVVFVAFLFQASSLFVLFGYLLYRLKPSTKMLFLLLGGAFILGACSPVSNWLLSHMMKFRGSNSILDRGLNYYGQEKYADALGVFRPAMLKQLAICLLAMRYRGFLSKQLKYFDVLFIFYCAYTMWSFIFNDSAIYSGRGGVLLGVGEPVIIASLLFLFKPGQRPWMAALFFLFAFGSFYLNMVQYDFPPYVSVLFGGRY